MLYFFTHLKTDAISQRKDDTGCLINSSSVGLYGWFLFHFFPPPDLKADSGDDWHRVCCERSSSSVFQTAAKHQPGGRRSIWCLRFQSPTFCFHIKVLEQSGELILSQVSAQLSTVVYGWDQTLLLDCLTVGPADGVLIWDKALSYSLWKVWKVH